MEERYKVIFYGIKLKGKEKPLDLEIYYSAQTDLSIGDMHWHAKDISAKLVPILNPVKRDLFQYNSGSEDKWGLIESKLDC